MHTSLPQCHLPFANERANTSDSLSLSLCGWPGDSSRLLFFFFLIASFSIYLALTVRPLAVAICRPWYFNDISCRTVLLLHIRIATLVAKAIWNINCHLSLSPLLLWLQSLPCIAFSSRPFSLFVSFSLRITLQSVWHLPLSCHSLVCCITTTLSHQKPVIDRRTVHSINPPSVTYSMRPTVCLQWTKESVTSASLHCTLFIFSVTWTQLKFSNSLALLRPLFFVLLIKHFSVLPNRQNGRRWRRIWVWVHQGEWELYLHSVPFPFCTPIYWQRRQFIYLDFLSAVLFRFAVDIQEASLVVLSCCTTRRLYMYEGDICQRCNWLRLLSVSSLMASYLFLPVAVHCHAVYDEMEWKCTTQNPTGCNMERTVSILFSFFSSDCQNRFWHINTKQRSSSCHFTYLSWLTHWHYLYFSFEMRKDTLEMMPCL